MTMLRAELTSTAFLLALAAAGACSPNNMSTAGPPGAQRVCPDTPEDTIGAACAVSGLTCGPQYTCGVVLVSLLCVCTGGVFQCADGTGRQLESGDQPKCPPPSPLGSCPATERSAQLAGCGDQGLICSYPSPCSTSLDQCQCFPGTTVDGGFGLRFECLPAPCAGPDAGPVAVDANDSSPAVDASPPVDSTTDTGADSGGDASRDDAAEADVSESDGQAD